MKKILYFCTLLLLTLFTSCTDTDSEPITGANPESIITQDTDLYRLVERNANTDPDTISVTCVRFDYPITVYVYNTASEAVAEHTIPDDAFFYAFLYNLDEGLAISIGYPVDVIDTEGVTTTINNNEELQAAMISCAEEQQIAWAESLFISAENTCIWQVGHDGFTEGTNAAYTGGYFIPDSNGNLTFTYEGEQYPGTWEFLFVEGQLQLSITLENADMATYWNHSYEVSVSENSIFIIAEGGARILTHQCETTETYTVGQTGPAGGIVFYDKGEYSDGWRYMEVEATETDTLLQWGCNTIALGTTHTGIGTGLVNSGKIKSFFDNLPGYYTNPVETCSDNADGTVAAGFGLYINNDNKQWFLPSQEELTLVYQNVAAAQLGNFGPYLYWTSTEVNEGYAIAVQFDGGETMEIPKYSPENIRVRRVRYF
jgi:hypothetical protein